LFKLSIDILKLFYIFYVLSLSYVILKGKRAPLIIFGLSGLFIFIIILSLTASLGLSLFILAGLGFFDQLMSALYFALAVDLLPTNAISTGSSFLNAGASLGSMFSMSFSGLMIDLFKSYHMMFVSLSFIALIGIIFTLRIKEKGHEISLYTIRKNSITFDRGRKSLINRGHDTSIFISFFNKPNQCHHNEDNNNQISAEGTSYPKLTLFRKQINGNGNELMPGRYQENDPS